MTERAKIRRLKKDLRWITKKADEMLKWRRTHFGGMISGYASIQRVAKDALKETK
jgi:hypothetical protein